MESPSDIEKLLQDNEFLAAGYFEDESASPMARTVNTYVQYFTKTPLTEYNGEKLWPCGTIISTCENFNRIAWPNHSSTLIFSSEAAVKLGYDEIADKIDNIVNPNATIVKNGFAVGGAGFTHSIPNYGRVLREGLDEHAKRSQAGLEAATANSDKEKIDFYSCILKLIDGIKVWHQRLIDALLKFSPSNEEEIKNRDTLLKAFRQVPFKPARTFSEAVIAYNFTFYLDNCDNQGCVDKELAEFYDRDLVAGILDDEQALVWLNALSKGCEDNWGWTSAIGGSQPNGEKFYHKLTELYMLSLTGRPRPNTELKIRPDTTDEIWEQAFNLLGNGNANPAFYNDELYLRSIRESGFCKDNADATMWCGCGCTETMIHGQSCVGSIDSGLNMPVYLEQTLQKNLAIAKSFDELLTKFKADLAAQIKLMVGCVNEYQKLRAETMPQPIRTLLIDDCISDGKDYYNGGAKYNGSNVNFAGLANITDSLAAIREMVFDKAKITGEKLLKILANNFEGHESFRTRLTTCPRFGNDDEQADSLAVDLATFVYTEVRKYKPWRGGVFMPSCIMFETYANMGRIVGATPDGRFAKTPIADSIGPMQARDINGPTAMLKSVAKLPHHLAVGTTVLNVRFAKTLFNTPEGRASVRTLIETYFAMGGMQMQVSVLDSDVLRDAVEHPEEHEDLIVRIGGYSTRFNKLSNELKYEVIKRTEHL